MRVCVCALARCNANIVAGIVFRCVCVCSLTHSRTHALGHALTDAPMFAAGAASSQEPSAARLDMVFAINFVMFAQRNLILRVVVGGGDEMSERRDSAEFNLFVNYMVPITVHCQVGGWVCAGKCVCVCQ